MASVVDICNLALSHLGDDATVSDIFPPDGSAQAEHCARFYPVARDSLLEMHDWRFATRRAPLARLDIDTWTWWFAYAAPADALKLVAVLPPHARSDEHSRAYETESDAENRIIIRTNVDDAVLRYTAQVTDTTKFPPLFVVTLSWHLASMLAGPIIKGDVGSAEAKRCIAMMQAYLTEAKVADANQRQIERHHIPDAIRARL